MKIGILTYHRSHNFGALFQAIATRKVLSDFGNDVYYIDYWPNYHVSMYSRFSFEEFIRRRIKDKYFYLRDCIIGYREKKDTSVNYKSFIRKYIDPYCLPMGTSFDLIIYGSDQIWRKQPWMKTYNPVYFGVHNSFSPIHASYAASMGILPSKNNVKDYQILKELLSNLDYLSVRELDLLELLNELGFYKVIQCLDPALLLTSKQWDEVFPRSQEFENIKDTYVLYVNYIPGSFEESKLRLFAEKKCKRFVKVNGNILGKDTPDAILGISPLDLLELIRNASYVFTSSFHAMVFSLLYGVPLYAGFANNGGRALSLLRSIGLSDCYLSYDTINDLDEIIIDYNDVYDKLEKMRIPSIEYLKQLSHNSGFVFSNV